MFKKTRSSKKKSIKQTGCSKTRRRKNIMKGGDAYNTIPARYIYPLNDYAIDPQRMMHGGKNKMRKYMYH